MLLIVMTLSIQVAKCTLYRHVVQWHYQTIVLEECKVMKRMQTDQYITSTFCSPKVRS